MVVTQVIETCPFERPVDAVFDYYWKIYKCWQSINYRKVMQKQESTHQFGNEVETHSKNIFEI